MSTTWLNKFITEGRTAPMVLCHVVFYSNKITTASIKVTIIYIWYASQYILYVTNLLANNIVHIEQYEEIIQNIFNICTNKNNCTVTTFVLEHESIDLLFLLRVELQAYIYQ